MILRRQTNFYFTAMSGREGFDLLSAVPETLLLGARGHHRFREAFEARWREHFGAADAIAFPSARGGLAALLSALGVGRGDEVILTAFTCAAVPDAVMVAGAVPVWADIDAATFAMTPPAVEALIGPRTRVILVQHTLGIPADTDRLALLARAHDVHLLEDACLALGSRKEGRPLGDTGEASIFSFELSKTLSAGWGGMVQTNRPELGEKVRLLRDRAGAMPRTRAASRLFQAGLSTFTYGPSCGWLRRYLTAALFKLGLFRTSVHHTDVAPTNDPIPSRYLWAQADRHWWALSRQLARLEANLEHARRVAERYEDVLGRHGAWMPAPRDPGVRFVRFPVLVSDPARMVAFFGGRGIEIGRWLNFPASLSPGDTSYQYSPGQCPVGEWVARHIVNLPVHSRLSLKDVDLACRLLDEYLARHADEREFIAAPAAVGLRP